MIKSVHGNLLDAKADVLVNTVNCVGVMGKGVALQFKQAYPENFKAYERACRRGDVQIGRMLVVPTGGLPGPRFIINFPTKRHWRGKSRLSDIDAGLIALADELRKLNVRSVAVPPLGCGNGGLDWREVRPRIERALAVLPDLEILLYEPDGAPAAESMPVSTTRPNMTRGRAVLLSLMQQYQGIGYRLTLLEIQKLAYFLQMAGEPLQLKYVKGKFGPYAENLNHVLQRIEGHYTRGYGDRSSGVEVSVVADALSQADEVIVQYDDARHHLDRVARLIDGFETPFGMELLATVHWTVVTSHVDVPRDVVSEVHRWNERKRKLFSEREILIAWRHLRNEGWLEAR